jgi:hypothetical protein
VNCVNFPLLEALLAGLWERKERERWTLSIAIVSLVIAIGCPSSRSSADVEPG